MSPSRALTLIVIFCALLECNSNHMHVAGQAVTSRRTLLQVQTTEDDVNAFLDGVEDSVMNLAGFVLSNYRRRQALWESGTCKTRCSVLSCSTRQLTETNRQCLELPEENKVFSSQFCELSPGNYTRCSKAAFSVESYVRLPGIPVDLDTGKISPDQQLTICSQQDLDQQIFQRILFPNGTRPDKIAWSMFGASNGVLRTYPGLELLPIICQNNRFDPRKRPWYRSMMGVSKQVVILLDLGSSLMANRISNTETTSLFDATVKIVGEFLDTLSTGDTVSVYTFGSTSPVNVGKVVMPDTSNDSVVNETLTPLKAAMEDISATFNAAPANLTAALKYLLSNNRGFNTSLNNSLKVILIFTGGKLAEGPTLSVPSISSIEQALTTLKIKLFIYQWKKLQSSDPTFTDLKTAACDLNAYYDEIPRGYILDDPLSALQSFYSYVAKIRYTLKKGKPLWTASYGPYNGLEDVIAVSYPVFDGDYLVGVAVITIFENLGQLWESVINERKDEDIVTNPGPSLNCSASLSSMDVAVPGLGNSNGGLCSGSNLAAQSYEARTCCEAQCNQIQLGGSSGIKLSVGAIVGTAIGGCLLIIVLIFLWFRKAIWRFPTMKKTVPGNGGLVTEATEPAKSPESVFSRFMG
ncbi:hypothetical protein R1flu_026148 [Riccia fluitans]|uniref:VWFA domain-containing protein n=1 Tax=Riccia fluitans TaxID=41844 RepID=A0ABD1XF58_9MARC